MFRGIAFKTDRIQQADVKLNAKLVLYAFVLVGNEFKSNDFGMIAEVFKLLCCAPFNRVPLFDSLSSGPAAFVVVRVV
jgi:hypothetical protein